MIGALVFFTGGWTMYVHYCPSSEASTVSLYAPVECEDEHQKMSACHIGMTNVNEVSSCCQPEVPASEELGNLSCCEDSQLLIRIEDPFSAGPDLQIPTLAYALLPTSRIPESGISGPSFVPATHSSKPPALDTQERLNWLQVYRT